MEICYPPPRLSSSSSSDSEEKVAVDVPFFFRCPISMELMKDPVTISTGITYDRKNIEKWFHVYKKTTCPTTMQRVHSFDLTPNHTLKRIISAFHASPSAPPKLQSTLLQSVISSNFEVSSLEKLRSVVATDGDGDAVLRLAGTSSIKVSIHIVEQISDGNYDSTTFRAAEEAVGILHLLSFPDNTSTQVFMSSAFTASMVILLQRGSLDGRLHTITLIHKLTRTSKDWCQTMADQGPVFYKSLLGLLSNHRASTLAASASIDVLIGIMTVSRRRRLRALEAGAGRTLIELLPDANRHKCEKLLLLLKLFCECPDGRSAVTNHGMGVAAVSSKILAVSDTATKVALKILRLVCGWTGTEKVVDDMMVFGAVKKLLALLTMDCKASVKATAVKILRLHGRAWQHHPCLSHELKENLRLIITCS